MIGLKINSFLIETFILEGKRVCADIPNSLENVELISTILDHRTFHERKWTIR